jgi:hypothetical protein
LVTLTRCIFDALPAVTANEALGIELTTISCIYRTSGAVTINPYICPLATPVPGPGENGPGENQPGENGPAGPPRTRDTRPWPDESPDEQKWTGGQIAVVIILSVIVAGLLIFAAGLAILTVSKKDPPSPTTA